MTLAQALSELRSFLRQLESIVNGRVDLAKDRIIEQNCISLKNHLETIKICVEEKVFIENFLDLIDYRLRAIYYQKDINKILVENDIALVSLYDSNIWYVDNLNNMGQYENELISILDDCIQRTDNIKEYLKSLYDTNYPY
jgi:hypothetical protein